MEKNQREIKTFIFNNGIKIPAIGLGTFLLIDGFKMLPLIKDALECGYRHFDTAVMYNNHELLGHAFKKIFAEGKYKRSEIFITTKVFPDKNIKLLDQLREIHKQLQMSYVDLLLVHWPLMKPEHGDKINQKPQHEIWAELEECYNLKLTKAIGVSNYNVQSLLNILSFCKIPPHANEIEVSPFLQQKNLLTFCNRFNIHVIGYAPLARGGLDAQLNLGNRVDLFNEPYLKFIASSHSVTVAQVVLNYLVYELGISVIPKTQKKERLLENYSISHFRLNTKQIELIKSLDKGIRTLDPGQLEIFGHIDIFA